MADEMRPEVRKAAEESWKRNEAGYRFLGAMEEAEKQHAEREAKRAKAKEGKDDEGIRG